MWSARTARERWIVASLALTSFMVTVDSSIVNISLPSIRHSFGVTTAEVSWVVVSYVLAWTAVLLPSGRLASVLGARRTFLFGFAVFTAGSLSCGMAPGMVWLVASRCVQGMGAGLMKTSAFALVPRLLPRDCTGWAYGILASAGAMGILVGAPLGGIITGTFSWHWVFLINGPIGAAALLVGARVLEKDPPVGSWALSRFDLPGALLGAFSVLALLLALNFGIRAGWTSFPIVSAFALAALFLVLFVAWERRTPEPSIDFGLLGNRKFVAGIVASSAAYMTYSGNAFVMPFYLEYVKGLRPEQVGPVLLAQAVLTMAAASAAGRLSDRVGTRSLTVSGTLVLTLAFALFSLSVGREGLFHEVIFLATLGIGFGAFFSPNNRQVMTVPAPEGQAVAAGMFQCASRVGLAMGVCLFEVAFARALPEGVSFPALAARIGTPQGEAILRAGFRDAWIAGSLLALVAVVASLSVRAETSRQRGGSDAAA